MRWKEEELRAPKLRLVPLKTHERRRKSITKVHANLVFSGVNLVVEVFFSREFKEMLVILLRCFFKGI